MLSLVDVPAVADSVVIDRYAAAVAAGLTKECGSCKQTKSISEFGRNRSCRHGANSECTACVVRRNADRAALKGFWPRKRPLKKSRSATSQRQSLDAYIRELVALHRGSPVTTAWMPSDHRRVDVRLAA